MVNKILNILKVVLLYRPLFGLFLCIVLFIIGLLYIYKGQEKAITQVNELPLLVDTFLKLDIKKTFVILIVYFSLSIGIILALRLSILGSYRSIANMNFPLKKSFETYDVKKILDEIYRRMTKEQLNDASYIIRGIYESEGQLEIY